MGSGTLVVIESWTEEERLVQWSGPYHEPLLQQLQELVQGYVEAVDITYKGKVCTAWVNEEARLRNMPLNVQASIVCGFRVYGPLVINI